MKLICSQLFLVGGFNPIQIYASKIKDLPQGCTLNKMKTQPTVDGRNPAPPAKINKTQKVSRIYYINSRFVGFFSML